ncbi:MULTISPECIES: asparaginase [Deinococcus]|uniref:Asparaginase n=1 Tax=Deinococcus rufus TaxID=2136097 RepID=A0ABV7Z593_9DEIO|nr:asparaginase [Deinococcus sp. AB2017081]WQE96404.1 asparaginase [Deinococcus sp. AB2017081]
MSTAQRLAVIHTGGTISSRPDPNGTGVTPQQAPSVPGLDGVQVTDYQPFTLPSPHVTPPHMLALARLVTEVAPQHDGVVITHGTDTLEETAFALHLLLPAHLPVVLTGSMRHMEEASWDGPGNLLDAAQVALHPATRGRGTLVVFGGDIFDARTVTKIHTTAVDAFGGYPGPIGRIDRVAHAARVEYFATPDARTPLTPPHLDARVEILYAYAGWQGEGFEDAVRRSDGVVIAALGTGNLPAPLLPLIQAATVPVVLATRTHAGPVLPVYGYPGGGATLVAAGAIPASFLNAHKARLLLLTLLSSGLEVGAIRRVFAQDVY